MHAKESKNEDSRLSLDMQTVFGMVPTDHVNLAADVGCSYISIGLSPPPWNPCRFPAWSLREDAKLRRALRVLLDDHSMVISTVEGFSIRSGERIENRAKDLDLVVELGALGVSTVCMEDTVGSATEELERLAEMTLERGLRLNLEFAPPHHLNTLDKALAAIRSLDRPHVRVTVDAMHFYRSGGTPSQLARLDSSELGYIQLCDAPLCPAVDDYMHEACFLRQVPGEGELALTEFIAALPDDLIIGLEVPMLAAAVEGRLKAAVIETVVAGKNIISKATRPCI